MKNTTTNNDAAREAGQIEIIDLGVKFGGKCCCCGAETGTREFERADTALVKVDGKFAVAHPRCIGRRTKRSIGGGRKWA